MGGGRGSRAGGVDEVRRAGAEGRGDGDIVEQLGPCARW
jgi:hypothetical protein